MGECLLYFLMSMGIGLLRGVWAMVALVVFGVVTCCIGFCATSIPFAGSYIVALLCLPVLTFDRAYVLYFVAQFGPEYQIGWQTPVGHGFPVIVDAPSEPPAAPGV